MRRPRALGRHHRHAGDRTPRPTRPTSSPRPTPAAPRALRPGSRTPSTSSRGRSARPFRCRSRGPPRTAARSSMRPTSCNDPGCSSWVASCTAAFGGHCDTSPCRVDRRCVGAGAHQGDVDLARDARRRWRVDLAIRGRSHLGRPGADLRHDRERRLPLTPTPGSAPGRSRRSRSCASPFRPTGRSRRRISSRRTTPTPSTSSTSTSAPARRWRFRTRASARRASAPRGRGRQAGVDVHARSRQSRRVQAGPGGTDDVIGEIKRPLTEACGPGLRSGPETAVYVYVPERLQPAPVLPVRPGRDGHAEIDASPECRRTTSASARARPSSRATARAPARRWYGSSTCATGAAQRGSSRERNPVPSGSSGFCDTTTPSGPDTKFAPPRSGRPGLRRHRGRLRQDVRPHADQTQPRRKRGHRLNPSSVERRKPSLHARARRGSRLQDEPDGAARSPAHDHIRRSGPGGREDLLLPGAVAVRPPSSTHPA